MPMATPKKKKHKPARKSPGGSLRDRLKPALSMLWGGRRMFYAALLFLLVAGVLVWGGTRSLQVRVGDIADEDVLSPRTMTYVDREATNNLRRAAAERAGQIYRVLPTFIGSLDSIFGNLLTWRGGGQGSEADLRAAIDDAGVKGDVVERLLALQKDDIVPLRLALHAALKQVAPNDVIGDRDLIALDDRTLEFARAQGMPNSRATLVRDLMRGVKDNLAADDHATRLLRRQVMAAVKPVRRTIHEREIVVRRGDQITAGKVRLMKELGMLRGPVSLMRVAGLIALAGLLMFGMAAYAKKFAPNVYRDEKLVAIFFILVGIAVAGSLVVTVFPGYVLGLFTGVLAILTCAILDVGLSLVAVPLVTLVVALGLDLKVGHIVSALACGFAAHYFAARRYDRDSFLKAAIAVGIAGMVTTLAVTALQFTGWRQGLIDVVAVNGINGLLAFVIATGSLPVFERIFNITTPRRLLELSNPEEPLLKQLLVQAPGTYHHSIFVGNLAESAADLIGADTLLVRIASYYHDVGKLKRPYFFTENVIHGGSQLNEMSPTLGALVIASHVKDGVEMAREYNLPPEVIRLMIEHHGTCLISFFYQQARAAAKNGDDVAKERFRYPGPAPQTLESAILMLADACEAAVRSLKEPTPKNIESQVNTIFEARLMDGQFEECNITLKQINMIRNCYIKTLAGVYHSRVEYPDLKEMEAGREV